MVMAQFVVDQGPHGPLRRPHAGHKGGEGQFGIQKDPFALHQIGQTAMKGRIPHPRVGRFGRRPLGVGHAEGQGLGPHGQQPPGQPKAEDQDHQILAQGEG